VLGETAREHLGYGSVWTAAGPLAATAALLATTLPRSVHAITPTASANKTGIRTVQRAPSGARMRVVSIMTAGHDATYGPAGIGCAAVARPAGLPSAFLVTGAASGFGMFALAIDHRRRTT
jgi:hypothetical protein